MKTGSDHRGGRSWSARPRPHASQVAHEGAAFVVVGTRGTSRTVKDPYYWVMQAGLDDAGPGVEREDTMETHTTTKGADPIGSTGFAWGWRGLSLDVARHWFGVEGIGIVLELMEPLDLNVLHLHLTDDQGWRIEVPGWPELTGRSSAGAVGGDGGGHLTTRDWEHLVDVAGEKGIALVPEIDVPGHTNAALHAVAGLNPDGVATQAYEGIEVGFSTLSARAPRTREFLQEVLGHAASLGNGTVHIGGDEPLSTSREEYLELVGLAVDTVHAAGARVVAWQEAADLVGPGDLVQIWDERQDFSHIVEAAARGVGVILSPASRTYLDAKYSDDFPLGLTWAGTSELRDCLEWDPLAVVPGLPPEAVVGVEAAMWTETTRTVDDLTTLLLPRLAAVADVAARGSGVGRWEEFRARVAGMAQEWGHAGRAWHRSPGVDWPA